MFRFRRIMILSACAAILSGGCGTTLAPITDWDGNWRIEFSVPGNANVTAVCISIKDGMVTAAEDGCSTVGVVQTVEAMTLDEYGQYRFAFSFNSVNSSGLPMTIFMNLQGVNTNDQLVGTLSASITATDGQTFGPDDYQFTMRRG